MGGRPAGIPALQSCLEAGFRLFPDQVSQAPLPVSRGARVQWRVALPERRNSCTWRWSSRSDPLHCAFQFFDYHVGADHHGRETRVTESILFAGRLPRRAVETDRKGVPEYVRVDAPHVPDAGVLSVLLYRPTEAGRRHLHFLMGSIRSKLGRRSTHS